MTASLSYIQVMLLCEAYLRSRRCCPLTSKVIPIHTHNSQVTPYRRYFYTSETQTRFALVHHLTAVILPSSKIRFCISFINPARPPNPFLRNRSCSSLSCSAFSFSSSAASRTVREDSRSSAFASMAWIAAALASSSSGVGSRFMTGERRRR